jgi:hypothetical protein
MPARARAEDNGLWDLEAAARGAASEAESAPFAFKYKNEEYTIPPMRDWPVRATVDVMNGDFGAALPELLGEAAFDKLTAAGLTVGEMTALFDKMAADAGMGGLPNSSPPARPNTTRR